MRKLLFAVALLATLGCGRDRYQLVSSDGLVYRLDKQTGEVIFIRQFDAIRVDIPTEEEERRAREEAEKPRKGRFTIPQESTP